LIKLIGKPGEKTFEVSFSPRCGFISKYSSLAKKGLYAHYCPTCTNVINVAFYTDTPVNLWPYEETNIISMAKDKFGTTLQTIPGVDDQVGTTHYNSKFIKTPEGNIQVLTLKNHILGYQGIVRDGKETSHFQVGERPCYNVGHFTFNQELVLKDLFSFWGGRNANFSHVNIPDIETFVEASKDLGFRLLTAYGDAPPVILFPLSKISNNYSSFYYELHRILNNFKKY
jgi:hypothetical protein